MSLWQKMGVSRVALSLAALSVAACSSPASNGSSPAGNGGGTAANVDTQTIPCGVNTGYPGDDLCIKPPDPSDGFQFHFGPKNYSDPNEVKKYLLQPGEEKTECVFFEGTNTETAYIREYHSRLRPGSHHLLNYVQPTTGPVHVSDGPEACNQSQNFRNLFGATSPKMDVYRNPGTENEGTAAQLGPRQQIVMQLHVINVTPNPILREAWANFRYTPKSTVTELTDPIQFIGGVTMSIPVGQTVVNHGTATVPSNAAPDFRLILAIPHYHAHTSNFKVWATRNGVRDLILETFSPLDTPDEPHLWSFSSAEKNDPPNEATKKSGAYSGLLHLAPGDTLDWECTQTNDGIGANGQRFTTPLQFTEQAYTGEMCNLFGEYAPSTGSAWSAYGL